MSIRLTTKNYTGLSLHPYARHTRQSRLPGEHPPSPAPSAPEPTFSANMHDEDVNRSPESSSDDQSPVHRPPEDAAESGTRRTSPLLKRKRPAPAMLARQSKRSRPKLEDTKDDFPLEDTTAQHPQTASQVEIDIFGLPVPASQRLSQKQKQRTYGNRQKSIFKVYDRVETIEDSAGPSKSLEVKETTVEEEPTTAKPELNMDNVAPAPKLEVKPVKAFREYAVPDLPSSASTAASDAQFKDLRSPPSLTRRPRSQSVSSLTSLSSEEGQTSANGISASRTVKESSTLPCPVCRKPLDRTLLHTAGTNMRSLSVQKQQDICHRHRLLEARDLAKERGYPTLNWNHIEHSRIPKLLDHLKRVLHRETTSFYLVQLDAQVATAKGKPKALRNYLHTGVLEIAKPGYYGLKGEKVIARAVTQALAKDLRKATKTVEAVSAAGVGPYVAAVLVPECTMKLVMQDMKTRSQERAREILAESTDVGRLLYSDDDRVETFDME